MGDNSDVIHVGDFFYEFQLAEQQQLLAPAGQLSSGSMIMPTDFTGNHAIAVGDIVLFDSTLNGGNGGVRSVTNADAPTHGSDIPNYPTGIALQALPLHTTNTYIFVQFKSIATLKTTPGETYTPFQIVSTFGVDPQLVTNATAGSPKDPITVGFVYITDGSLSIAGGAGVTISVILKTESPFSSGWGVLPA